MVGALYFGKCLLFVSYKCTHGYLFLLVYHTRCVVTPWSKTQHITHVISTGLYIIF